jgi:hypothetical protein
LLRRPKAEVLQCASCKEGVVTEILCDKYTSMTLSYLYHARQAYREDIEKISVDKEGILLSRGRKLDDMNFRETAELPRKLGSQGKPLLERHSPLAYSVAEHIHWDLAKDNGVKTYKRISLENVFIIQEATLYKEIIDDCKYKMKRKMFLEATMGPISDSQLTLAPPCWMVQVDLTGQC